MSDGLDGSVGSESAITDPAAIDGIDPHRSEYDSDVGKQRELGDTALRDTEGELPPRRLLEIRPAIAALAVLGTSTFIIVMMMRPDLLVSRTTPTGGDNAAHYWMADYLKRELIPSGRLFGWSNDSFAGLPVLSSYFPLPTWIVTALSYLIPMQVAFKLVSVTGTLVLPWLTYRLGRRGEMRWPEPLFLGVGTIPFLLSGHYKILGGNLLSTMAGEYSFSLSLAFAVLYMGSLIRLLRTGTGRVTTCCALLATALSHIVPSVFAILFTVACCLVELRRSRWLRQLLDLWVVGTVAVLATAFWTLPFLGNLPYSNSMDYEKNTRVVRTLMPLLPKSSTLHTPKDRVAYASVYFVFALIAAAVGIRRRERFTITMTLTAALAGVSFAMWPRSAMWNNRLLPSWFFCVYTLGAVGMLHTARRLVTTWERRKKANRAMRRLGFNLRVTALAGLVSAATIGPALALPSADLPFSWARGNFAGGESRKQYPTFTKLITTLKTLPCGRAWFESNKDLATNIYGSTLTFMTVPQYTKSCIQVVDGMYFEASQTTPFHYLTVNMLTKKGVRSQRRLPYGPYDVSNGLTHLRRLGVRYAVFSTKEGKAEARKHETLSLKTSTGPFDIFEIRDNAVVEPLTRQPTVVTGVKSRASGEFVNMGLAQWMRPTEFPETLVIDGPASWTRAPLRRRPQLTPTATTNGRTKTAKAVKPPAPRRGDGLFVKASETPIEATTVSNVRVEPQTVSFDVDRVGSPVLVRISWYPNWRVRGADGPYRASPNFMVVVPTGKHVQLDYVYTGTDKAAIALSVMGLGALAGLAAQQRRRRLRDA